MRGGSPLPRASFGLVVHDVHLGAAAQQDCRTQQEQG